MLLGLHSGALKDIALSICLHPQTNQLLKTEGEKSIQIHECHGITWPQSEHQWSPGTESHFLDSCVGKRKAVKLHSQLRLPILRPDRKSKASLIPCNRNKNKNKRSHCSQTVI